MKLLLGILCINLFWEVLILVVRPTIVVNKLIPFKGFLAIAIAPFVFIKWEPREYTFDDKVFTHEYKHILQQRIFTPLGFFVFYILQFLYNLIIVRHSFFNAYWHLVFEKQAREFERMCIIDVKKIYNKNIIDLTKKGVK